MKIEIELADDITLREAQDIFKIIHKVIEENEECRANIKRVTSTIIEVEQ